jgi:phosphoglycolate phosphatase-like HAD superfamily hydrolase
MTRQVFLLALFAIMAPSVARAQATDPLRSWNDGPAKSAITSFVSRATTEGGPEFVPQPERIAVFDNDGTLWCEQPIYFQLAFVLDRVRALAPDQPEWKGQSPFKEVLAGDVKSVLAGGQKPIGQLMAVTHSGMTTDEFAVTVRDWLRTARHPKFNRPYNECIYQPMIELLAYLRAHGFKTFIVSGGGVEFMRVWAEDAYGVPPEQVIGSSGKLKYELRDGQPVLVKLPELDFIDDKAGKPVGIQQHIGRRPILAFGNSDGDFEMLEWTTASESPGLSLRSGEPGRPRPQLGLLIHHTDATREYAYDRNSPIGQLARGLDEAPKRGWIVIDMQNDWKDVFP